MALRKSKEIYADQKKADKGIIVSEMEEGLSPKHSLKYAFTKKSVLGDQGNFHNCQDTLIQTFNH